MLSVDEAMAGRCRDQELRAREVETLESVSSCGTEGRGCHVSLSPHTPPQSGAISDQ